MTMMIPKIDAWGSGKAIVERNSTYWDPLV